MKKFAIHPGKVKSKYDGEIHYIGYDQLIKLHGLNRLTVFFGTIIQDMALTMKILCIFILHIMVIKTEGVK